MDAQQPGNALVPLLQGEPTINDDQRADLFDVFHSSKDPQALMEHLQTLAVPDDFKKRLLAAKQQALPTPEPLDKTTAAIQRLAQMDPNVLALAEAHPNVLKAMTAAATTPEKAPAEPTGASKSASKGKTPADGAKRPALVQPPRPDGLEHLPPIPDQHYRVLSSDGGIHDLPMENIDQARELDPRLQVLNP